MRRPRLRLALLIAGGVLAVVVAAGVWVGVRAMMAVDEFTAMTPLATSLRSAIGSGDVAKATAVSAELGVHAEKAAGLTGDPVWRLAEFIPGVGPNLAAARVASAGLDRLARDVVGPLALVAESSFSARGSIGVDAAALAAAHGPLLAAQTALTETANELDGIDASGLIARLATGVADLRTMVSAARTTVDPLVQATAILPPLLGVDGPRSILLMVQNNAELRTGGGVTGTFVLLHAENGHLAIVDQADSSQFAVRADPIQPIPEELTALYGDVIGRHVQDASMPADFALTGELAAKWWTSRTGTAPDAVISIDPLVLRALLDVTGPVALPDGVQLTTDGFVHQLLVAPYLNLDVQKQDNYFAETATTVFQRLTSGSLNPKAWADALAGPVDAGRISIWSADPAAEAVIAGTVLGGPAARQKLGGDNAYALYLNDATGAKLDSFLTTSVASGVAACRADGRREVVISVTLTNTVPVDAVAQLPWSLTGGGLLGVAAGDIATVVSVSAPVATYAGGIRVDGALVGARSGTDAGYPVSLTRVTVAPGQTTTVEFRFVTDRTSDFSPVVLHTPLVSTPDVTKAAPACRS